MALLWVFALLATFLTHNAAARVAAPPSQEHLPPHRPNATEPRVPCTIAGITSILPDRCANVSLTVQLAQPVVGGTFGEGPINLAHPEPAYNLPDGICAVIIRVVNQTDVPVADFRFGLFLPAARDWNGRFLAVGNSAFSGGINWPQMGQGPHYGFATLSTDTGHSSPQAGQIQWALNRPDLTLDWGYRAVRGSVAVGKAVVENFYRPKRRGSEADDDGRKPPPRRERMRSYFSGCSTGGRQALKAAQIDPDSFDGMLVGSAAWDTKHLMPWITKIGTDNLRPDGSLIFDPYDPAWIIPFAAQIVAQCDAADGIVDRIISAPEKCVVDFSRFTCPPGVPPIGCLTAEQVVAVKKVYSNYFIPDGKGGTRLAHNGMELGSELQWASYLGATSPTGFDADWERFWLYNDTTWSWRQFSDQVVLDSERINPGQATADDFASLTRFRDRGGKILMYHGEADGIVPPQSSTLFYNRTLSAIPGGLPAVEPFFRLFMVPGMQHCFFTPPDVNAPWMFAGAGQATALQLLPPATTTEDVRAGWGTPGFRGDPEYDALLKLMQWVEGDRAPDSFNAVAYNADWSVFRTRKICPYPKRAFWNGRGQNEAKNWFCA